MEACHRVRSIDPTDYEYNHGDDPEYRCLTPHADNTIYYLFRNWGRSCPYLEEKISSLANNTLATGSLDLEGPETGFSSSYRIAGSQFKYKCSKGFSLPDGTNPEQLLSCSGSLKVDTTQVTLCERKHPQDSSLNNCQISSQQMRRGRSGPGEQHRGIE
jgi:hypothetical protein